MTSTTATEDDAPPVPHDDPAGEHLWSPLLTIAVAAIVIFLLGIFVSSRLAWPVAFARSALRLVTEPSIGGLWPVPSGLAIALPVLAIVAVQGWLAAKLLLAGSDLERDLALVSGLAITIAISILGLGGTLAVVAGRLARLELLVVYAATGIGIGFLTLRRRGLDARTLRRRGRDAVLDLRRRRRRPAPPRAAEGGAGLRRATTAVVAVAIVFTFAHATLTPVTEWDALAYHAEAARTWYLEAPDPTLRYGPSIGIEISGNYPPLFPAAGAAMYSIVGAFDDVYLRMLPPLLFAALILMVRGYARRRFGAGTALLAALLVAGSPLTIAYGSWTTSYALLGALLFAVVIVVDVARERDALAPWVGAGVVAGLAILTHFYGLLALLAGIAALLTGRRRPWRRVAVFGAVALAVASPWLLRNLILLGDPFYPLGTPPFDGKGLEPELWDASKSGIKNAALAYWGYARGSTLAIRLISTSLFDRLVLLTGAYFGLWYGLFTWRRSSRVAFLSAFLVAALLALLLPGWYWLRALVAIVPVGALLTARLLAELLDAASSRLRRKADVVARVAHASISAAVGFVAVVAAAVAVSVAIAGPGYRGMHVATTDDVMTSVRSWGSPRLQLWRSFGGDVRMWEWLDEHVEQGERFATLEIRTYHLGAPDAPLYLDGVEAVPLMRMRSPSAVEGYLRAEGVRYIAMPGWATFPPTPGMISGILPLFRYLGTDPFPAVAVFPVSSPDRPSVIYAVGAARDEPRVGFWSVAPTGPPPLDQRSAFFPRSSFGNRIFVPTPTSEPVALRFEYDTRSGVEFSLTHLIDDGERDLWVAAPEAVDRWQPALVPLPPDEDGVIDLDVFARRGDLSIRDADVVELDAPVITDPEPLDSGEATWTIGRREIGRVSLPVRADEQAVVSFRYRDTGRGSVAFAVIGVPDTDRVRATWRLTGSGGWVERRVPVSSSLTGFIGMTLSRTGDAPLLVRDLRVGLPEPPFGG